QADINYQLFHKEPRLAAGSSWDTPDMVAEDSRGADVNLVKTAYNFTVIRNGQKLHLENVPLYAVVMDDGSREIYLDFVNAREDKTFVNVIVRAGKETASLSRLIIITLVDLIRGTYGLNEISGPVGVVNAIGEVSQTGFERGVEAGGFWTGIKEGLRMCLFMAALITINVGIFNLLPVPALDGARFLFLGVEAVRRKPVKAEVEGMIHFVGFAALMLFMLVITVFDIRGLFQ
ncbi:MAG: site-2 protease family protein, partial [Oscillospiraceae bacterium]|nr:site-2 protease family protein [Oscillospiraceae bacterium]